MTQENNSNNNTSRTGNTNRSSSANASSSVPNRRPRTSTAHGRSSSTQRTGTNTRTSTSSSNNRNTSQNRNRGGAPHSTNPRRRNTNSHSSTASPQKNTGNRGGKPQHHGRPTKRPAILSKNTTYRKVQRRPRNMSPSSSQKKEIITTNLPPIGDNIRIIPLGGVEEVGKNMTAIEIGNDIIVIDAGFQFKDDLSPGIDYIIPNTKYLKENKHKIRGLFITHGHLDHIGAVPYVIEDMGNPPIYTRQFGAIMIQKRNTEFPQLPKANIVALDGDETITIGDTMKIETFAISHTIPDSMGLVIKTHWGDIVFVEDVRVDNIEGVPTDEEVEQYKRFKDKDVLMLTMDSTSIEKPGWSLSEQVVVKNLEKVIKAVKGRLFIGTFASQVERIMAIIQLAEKYNKKVVIEGRSMKSNMEIVKLLKLMDAPNIIPISEIDNTPPDRLIFLVTGSQGEEFAVLNRVANNQHKVLKFKEEDTILLSSSIIPTNHNPVTRLKNGLYRSKAHVITYLDSDIHASGHGNKEELGWIHDQVNYRFFMPVHGEHFMLRQHGDMAIQKGAKPENVVVPDNGSVIEISDGGKKISKLPMKVPADRVTVDGFSVSDMQEVVFHDRKLLSESGIFVIVATINTRTRKLRKSPDIISRGFIYLRESQELLQESRQLIRRTIEKHIKNKKQIDFDKLKDVVAKEVGNFLFQQTAKEPIVIPVINGV